jgi:hypothetical protein
MDWFKKGVVSFFVGHLCYLIAFFLIGQSWYYTGITALGTTPFLFFYYYTVRPRVPRDMRYVSPDDCTHAFVLTSCCNLTVC